MLLSVVCLHAIRPTAVGSLLYIIRISMLRHTTKSNEDRTHSLQSWAPRPHHIYGISYVIASRVRVIPPHACMHKSGSHKWCSHTIESIGWPLAYGNNLRALRATISHCKLFIKKTHTIPYVLGMPTKMAIAYFGWGCVKFVRLRSSNIWNTHESSNANVEGNGEDAEAKKENSASCAR